MWHLQAAFAATCMTIVSGATAERMDYAGYLITRCFSFCWPILIQEHPYRPPIHISRFQVLLLLVWSILSLHTGHGLRLDGSQQSEDCIPQDLILLSFQGLHGFCWICCGSSGWCCSLLAWLCHPWSQVQYSHSFGFIDCSLVQD